MREISIGYLDPFPPFCRCGPEGRAEGLFVAILEARAEARGLRLAWHPGLLEALPLALAEGTIEAIAAKALIPERAGTLCLSEPLMETAAALFGPVGSVPPDITRAGAARIATPAEGPLAALVARLAPGSRVVAARDYPDALATVLDGRADWAALNADAGAAEAERAHPGRSAPPGPRFAPLGLSVAVSPGDPHGVLTALGLRTAI
ncbi:MAG: transporter substrate-binding domain-containing protein [Rhodobacteraceae bacterium]|nr:transporter substrate-binding domain-containing protein [Paracoccaceae bacterium]